MLYNKLKKFVNNLKPLKFIITVYLKSKLFVRQDYLQIYTKQKKKRYPTDVPLVISYGK